MIPYSVDSHCSKRTDVCAIPLSLVVVPVTAKMSNFRKNTLIVDFSVLPKRPDAAKVQKFLEKEVHLQLSDAVNIQLHNIRNCVFIEMVNADTALRYQNQHNYKHVMSCDGKEFKIPVYVERESVTVRVHDLPPQMPLTTVVEYMQQYGTVISISRERWKHFFPGHHNGVLVLQVKLEHPIPSFLTISGESTLVTYRNQSKTCRFCGKAAHPKQKCSKTAQDDTNNTIAMTAAASVSTQANKKASDLQTAQPNNNTENAEQNNTENAENTTDDDSSSDADGSDSAFTEAMANQKRRLTRLKENRSKKVCMSQQNPQDVSNITDSNRFEALVELDWITPADLKRMNKKAGKGGFN